MENELKKDDPYRYWRNRWYPFIHADYLVEAFLSCSLATGWIQRARQALLYSTNELADRIGISSAAVCKMERSEAKGTISLETLKRAADALDCELVYAFRPKSKKLFSKIIWDAMMGNGPLPGERFFHKASNAFGRMKNIKVRRKNKWTIRRHYHDIRNQIKRKT